MSLRHSHYALIAITAAPKTGCLSPATTDASAEECFFLGVIRAYALVTGQEQAQPHTDDLFAPSHTFPSQHQPS